MQALDYRNGIYSLIPKSYCGNFGLTPNFGPANVPDAKSRHGWFAAHQILDQADVFGTGKWGSAVQNSAWGAFGTAKHGFPVRNGLAVGVVSWQETNKRCKYNDFHRIASKPLYKFKVHFSPFNPAVPPWAVVCRRFPPRGVSCQETTAAEGRVKCPWLFWK